MDEGGRIKVRADRVRDPVGDVEDRIPAKCGRDRDMEVGRKLQCVE
jgi:hypothetical protein